MYSTEKTQALLETLEVRDRNRYLDKIKKYRNECGCAMGGVFVLLATFLYVLYTCMVFREASFVAVIKVVFGGILTLFISGGLGKMIGIYLAKIKLFLLFRSITANLHKKTSGYGNMYKMGQ
jgi:hypothetical protein